MSCLAYCAEVLRWPGHMLMLRSGLCCDLPALTCTRLTWPRHGQPRLCMCRMASRRRHTGPGTVAEPAASAKAQVQGQRLGRAGPSASAPGLQRQAFQGEQLHTIHVPPAQAALLVTCAASVCRSAALCRRSAFDAMHTHSPPPVPAACKQAVDTNDSTAAIKALRAALQHAGPGQADIANKLAEWRNSARRRAGQIR